MTRDVAFLLDPRCEDAKPFRVAAALAFFNQATCSTSVVNYAPRVLQRVGMASRDDAVLFASFVSFAKLAGGAAAIFAVDSLKETAAGRRVVRERRRDAVPERPYAARSAALTWPP